MNVKKKFFFEGGIVFFGFWIALSLRVVQRRSKTQRGIAKALA
jgi:hypothetical protein